MRGSHPLRLYYAGPWFEVGSPQDLPISSREARLQYEEGTEASDNSLRATWAAQAVQAYAARTGLLVGEPVDTAIGDLLSDLMHMVDALKRGNSLDPDCNTFEEILEKATRRYEEEIRGEI